MKTTNLIAFLKKRVAVTLEFPAFNPYSELKVSDYINFSTRLLQAAGIDDLPLPIQEKLFSGPVGPVQTHEEAVGAGFLVRSKKGERFPRFGWEAPQQVSRTHRRIDPSELHGFAKSDVELLSRLTDDLIYDHAKALAKKVYRMENALFMKELIYDLTHDYHYFNDAALQLCEFLAATLSCRRDCILAEYGVHREVNDPQREERFFGMHRTVDIGCNDRFVPTSLVEVMAIATSHPVVAQPSFLAFFERFKSDPTIKVGAGIVVRAADGRIFIHNPKTQEKGAFQGYAHKVNEFSRGGYDSFCATDDDDTIHRGLQITALKEAYEECGIAGHNLRYLTDISVGNHLIRYYVADYKSGDPRFWERSPINETKSVILTPIEKLIRLFESNVGGCQNLGSSDLLVLEHLIDQINPKTPAEFSLDFNGIEHVLPDIDHLSSDRIDSVYTAYCTHKYELISESYASLSPNDSKEVAIINGDRVIHFDGHFGRVNKAWNIPEFATFLKSRYPDISEDIISDKIKCWISDTVHRQFQDGSLCMHNFAQISGRSGLEKFDDGVLNDSKRIPLLCTTLIRHGLPLQDLGVQRDYFTGRRNIFLFPKATPLVMARRDVHSTNSVAIFNHPHFKSGVKRATHFDEMKSVVHQTVLNGSKMRADGPRTWLQIDLLDHDQFHSSYHDFLRLLAAGESREWSYGGRI